MKVGGAEVEVVGEGAPIITLHPMAGTPDRFDDLNMLLSMHAQVFTPDLLGQDPLAVARAIVEHVDADTVAVIAEADAAHIAYALAVEGLASALVLIAAEPPVSELEPALSALDIPVFLVWGEDDEITPESVGENLTDIFPGATLGVVPESGHDVLVTDAPTVVPLIKEYLKVRYLGVTHGHDDGPVLMDVSFTRPPNMPPAN